MHDSENDVKTWFGLSISGPSLSSWSVVLDINLASFEAEEKLMNLKKSIKLEKKTTAFSFISVNKKDFQESYDSKTLSFKKVFPNIPLTCIYNSDEFPLYCINSTQDGKFLITFHLGF